MLKYDRQHDQLAEQWNMVHRNMHKQLENVEFKLLIILYEMTNENLHREHGLHESKSLFCHWPLNG